MTLVPMTIITPEVSRTIRGSPDLLTWTSCGQDNPV